MMHVPKSRLETFWIPLLDCREFPKHAGHTIRMHNNHPLTHEQIRAIKGVRTAVAASKPVKPAPTMAALRMRQQRSKWTKEQRDAMKRYQESYRNDPNRKQQIMAYQEKYRKAHKK